MTTKPDTNSCGIATALNQLEQLKHGLEVEDDKISDRLQDFERALQALHLGVPIHVCIGSIENDKESVRVFLTFRKTMKRGEWRLMRDISLDGSTMQFDEQNCTHIMSCQRDFRSDVVRTYFKALVLAAVNQMVSRIEQRREGLEESSRLLITLAVHDENRLKQRCHIAHGEEQAAGDDS